METKSVKNPTNSLEHGLSAREMAVDLMLHSSWFEGLDPASVRAMAHCGQAVHYRRGDSVFSCGSVPLGLGVIVNGVLLFTAGSRGGKRHLVHLESKGSVICMLSALDGGQAVHDASARSESTVLWIGRGAFREVLDADATAAASVMAGLCQRTRSLYLELSSWALLPLRARVARTIQSLLPMSAASAVSEIALAQEELAEMLGCSRQSVSRELLLLERQGVLKVSYAALQVLNEAALREVVLNG